MRVGLHVEILRRRRLAGDDRLSLEIVKFRVIVAPRGHAEIGSVDAIAERLSRCDIDDGDRRVLRATGRKTDRDALAVIRWNEV